MEQVTTEGLQSLELPKHLQEVIDRIPPQVPEIFKNQAKITAKYIQELDQGNLDDNHARDRFVQQLSSTGFIRGVYIRHSFGGLFQDAPLPKNALPAWLFDENIRRGKYDPEKVKPIQEMYDKWANQSKFGHHKNEFGEFSEFPNQDNSIPMTHWFKVYVEGGYLKEGLGSGDLPVVLDKLTTANLNPNQMKLFEGSRLVLYFGRDIKQIDQIRKQFNDYGLDFRGPAQDVYEVRVEEDGSLKLDNFTSNDGGLGEGGHSVVDYKLKRYNSAEFLDNYLQLCLYAGKDPSEPYKTSFVWFVDREGKMEGDEKKKLQAEKIAAYPILYTRHRLDIVRKQSF